MGRILQFGMGMVRGRLTIRVRTAMNLILQLVMVMIRGRLAMRVRAQILTQTRQIKLTSQTFR